MKGRGEYADVVCGAVQVPLQAWRRRLADRIDISRIAESRSAITRRMLVIALVADLLFIGLAALSLRRSRHQTASIMPKGHEELNHMEGDPGTAPPGCPAHPPGI
jgi:hypothetical protein